MGNSDSRALARATKELRDAGDQANLPLPLEKQGGLCGEVLCGPSPWRVCQDGAGNRAEGVCVCVCECACACASVVA